MNRFKTWNHKRLFLKAYRILRNESERHTAAGHQMTYEALDTNHVRMECVRCPNHYP